MTKKEQYERNKPLLLNDKSICEANRKLFKEYLKEKEYKLKRQKGIPKLTETQYKTLCQNISSLRNINLWFKNKDLTKITVIDIKKVYDGLEEQKIKGVQGNVIKSKNDYYEKYFKSLLFEMTGKKELAQKVMKYYNSSKKEEVRFFEEETHERIKNATKTIHQKALCQLAWDVGENIFTLLQLQKKDFIRRINKETKEVEYLVNLPKEKLKASRRERTEITNFEETSKLLDIVLKDLKDESVVFNFGHRNALKFLKQAVKKVNGKCIPKGQEVTWKDYRSSMACYLLGLGWTTDEIKSRMGHAPSSRVIDKYVNYLAIGKHKPKTKVNTGKITELKSQVDKLKQQQKTLVKQLQNKTINKDEILKEIHNQLQQHQFNFKKMANEKWKK